MASDRGHPVQQEAKALNHSFGMTNMCTSFRNFASFAKGFVLATAVAGLSASANAAPEKRVALVMGNGAYEKVAPLANPPSDARAVSAALKRMGFEVVEG